MQRLCGTPYERVDAAWLRLRAACRIAPISSAWSRPDLWVRRALGLDPQRLTLSDAECVCAAMERDLTTVRGLRRPENPAAAGTP
ncbi:hypothetical protein J2847_006447 [Azospirillum agricola]|uniref:hypothetical protein n=1 Tax=Azospirillum agricola TaxID=1720247 RepID=UPI001AE202CF|nr:hypothetical protein [Azospirillum agricola]MBP2233112.1 hypothetical protein [Azospirillum agricola]